MMVDSFTQGLRIVSVVLSVFFVLMVVECIRYSAHRRRKARAPRPECDHQPIHVRIIDRWW